MKKNVLGGPHKQFECCQHTKIHLSGLKAQYEAKMELFPDGVNLLDYNNSLNQSDYSNFVMYIIN